jgi:integrase
MTDDEKELCPRCGAEMAHTHSGGTHNGRAYMGWRCNHCNNRRYHELHGGSVRKPKVEKQPTLRKKKAAPEFSFSPDWDKCYQSFLSAIYERSRATTTLVHYRAILADFFLSVPGRQPDEISRDEVEQYLRSPGTANGRKGQMVKASTRNNRLACLRAFYKHAANYAVMDAQGVPQPLLRRLPPTAGIQFNQREEPPKRSLSEEELSRFFAQCDTSTVLGARDKSLFLCYFLLARRRSELCGLRYGQIMPAVIVEPGGARRQGWIYQFPRAKSHKGEDSAELLPICKQAIDHYLDVSGRATTIQAGDPIFITDKAYHGQGKHDAHRAIAPVTVWHICKRIAKRAGLDERITVHSFRHASAQHRYLQGQDVFAINVLLRHRSLDMTKLYLDGLAGQADMGADIMEKRFGNL